MKKGKKLTIFILLLLSLLLFLCSFRLYSDPLKKERITTFKREFKGYVGNSVIETKDENYIVVGTATGFKKTGLDLWLMKTDKEGKQIWNKSFGGFKNDTGLSVKQTRDNGYIITGTTKSYGAGCRDGWVLRTDEDGNEVWNNTYGGLKDDWTISVEQTKDDGFIIVGGTESYGTGNNNSDIWILRLKHDGAEMWNRTFGGNDTDCGFYVNITKDEGFIIAGTGGSDAPWGKRQAYVIKTDSLGHEIWNYTSDRNEWNFAEAVLGNVDGSFTILCRTNYQYDTIKLVKIDRNGTILWNKKLDSIIGYSCSFDNTIDGGYIITGELYTDNAYDICLLRTDQNGNEIWTTSFDFNDDFSKSVKQTRDGGYIIAGYSNYWTRTSMDEQHIAILIKVDSTGQINNNENGNSELQLEILFFIIAIIVIIIVLIALLICKKEKVSKN